jgi:nuclease S1
MNCRKMQHRTWAMAVMALTAMTLTTELSWSWGRIGHRVSSRMAEVRLTPAALAAVHRLLEPGEGLADVCMWADEQRQVPESGPWHHVNVPISEPRYDPRYCPPTGCVVSKIEDFKHILMARNSTREQRQQALRFLIHFIQDLHQPLHVGDTGSRGGNMIQVRFLDIGSNLHEVWDSKILERHSQNEQVWLWELDGLAKPRMVAEWAEGSVDDWATESLTEAKLAYRIPGGGALLKSGAKLGDDYCLFALPIIQRRLAQSGIRVAVTLNSILR